MRRAGSKAVFLSNWEAAGVFFLPQNAAVNFDSRKTKQLMKQLRKNVCETMDTEVRTVIYTTNAIESLNATYRKPQCHLSQAEPSKKRFSE